MAPSCSPAARRGRLGGNSTEILTGSSTVSSCGDGAKLLSPAAPHRSCSGDDSGRDDVVAEIVEDVGDTPAATMMTPRRYRMCRAAPRQPHAGGVDGSALLTGSPNVVVADRCRTHRAAHRQPRCIVVEGPGDDCIPNDIIIVTETTAACRQP